MDKKKKTEAAPLPEWMQVQFAMVAGIQDALVSKSEGRVVSFVLARDKESGEDKYILGFGEADCQGGLFMGPWSFLVGRDSLKVQWGDGTKKSSEDLKDGELGEVSELVARGVTRYILEGAPSKTKEATDE